MAEIAWQDETLEGRCYKVRSVLQSLCWGLYLLYNNSCPPDSSTFTDSNDVQTNAHTSDSTLHMVLGMPSTSGGCPPASMNMLHIIMALTPAMHKSSKTSKMLV